jgi:hypothetical protein
MVKEFDERMTPLSQDRPGGDYRGARAHPLPCRRTLTLFYVPHRVPASPILAVLRGDQKVWCSWSPRLLFINRTKALCESGLISEFIT